MFAYHQSYPVRNGEYCVVIANVGTICQATGQVNQILVRARATFYLTRQIGSIGQYTYLLDE